MCMQQPADANAAATAATAARVVTIRRPRWLKRLKLRYVRAGKAGAGAATVGCCAAVTCSCAKPVVASVSGTYSAVSSDTARGSCQRRGMTAAVTATACCGVAVVYVDRDVVTITTVKRRHRDRGENDTTIPTSTTATATTTPKIATATTVVVLALSRDDYSPVRVILGRWQLIDAVVELWAAYRNATATADTGVVPATWGRHGITAEHGDAGAM